MCSLNILVNNMYSLNEPGNCLIQAIFTGVKCLSLGIECIQWIWWKYKILICESRKIFTQGLVGVNVLYFFTNLFQSNCVHNQILDVMTYLHLHLVTRSYKSLNVLPGNIWELNNPSLPSATHGKIEKICWMGIQLSVMGPHHQAIKFVLCTNKTLRFKLIPSDPTTREINGTF